MLYKKYIHMVMSIRFTFHDFISCSNNGTPTLEDILFMFELFLFACCFIGQ